MLPRRKYKNPPLIETIFEVGFSHDRAWDLAIPGLLWERINQHGYTNRQNRMQKEYQISEQDDASPQVRIHERAVFLSEDKKDIVQIGDRFLAVNRLKPYLSWEEFKPRITKACTALQEVLGTIETAERLILRYVNQIRIPKNGFILEEYFNFRPFLGGGMFAPPQALITGCVFSENEGKDQCKLELISTNTKNSDEVAFFLILEMLPKSGTKKPWQDVIPWVETAHSEIENHFEKCLTPPLRKIFGVIEE